MIPSNAGRRNQRGLILLGFNLVKNSVFYLGTLWVPSKFIIFHSIIIFSHFFKLFKKTKLHGRKLLLSGLKNDTMQQNTKYSHCVFLNFSVVSTKIIPDIVGNQQLQQAGRGLVGLGEDWLAQAQPHHTTQAEKNKQEKLEHIEDNGFIFKKINKN